MVQDATIAIIVAAGRGSRAGPGGPKQYRLLLDRPVIAWTIEAFAKSAAVDAIRVIIHHDDHEAYVNAIRDVDHAGKLMAHVIGGAERQDSVRLGLESFSDMPPERVLIHDAARPFVDNGTIARVCDALARNSGAIAALPIHDTIKRADENGLISETTPRIGMWRAQTPQGFRYADILAAHRSYQSESATDDAAIAEMANIDVALVLGSPDNMKITQADDFGMAEVILQRKNTMKEYRTGHGFDVHAFEPGSGIILCGVDIAHTMKLKGHSDADVGMHALTDAILGALSAGDIGSHFPPSDPKWKGAPSHVFLDKARELVSERNGEITHCDVTIICEAPKIGPHRAAMSEALARILKVDVSRLSVKATTTEQLGFNGRKEGISAMATATLALPIDS